ncbi:MAG: aldo/keto reductase [Achromobacter sp.]
MGRDDLPLQPENPGRATFLRLAGAAAVCGALAPVARAGASGARGDPAQAGKALTAAQSNPASVSAKSPGTAVDPMLRRPIGTTGDTLPVIGCGTYRTFDIGDADRSEHVAVVRTLVEAGGSVIDSSPMYGSAERVVGDVLAASGLREQVFVATKVWTRGREQGIAQMEASMRALQVSQVDLMQIHNLVDWRTQLKTLQAWKASGRIRYLGITHYTPGAHDDLIAVMREAPIDAVQLNYAANDRAAEQRLLPFAAERGVAVIVNQPFGGGGLLRRLSAKPLPGFAAELQCETWAQLLLKFVLAHPAVTCAIPGTSNARHMRSNAQAGSGPSIDRAMAQRIAQAVSDAA